MKIQEAMSRDAAIAAPNNEVGAVAKLMASKDIGCMPVGDGDRLVGMITDRDIALRVIGKGKDSHTPVREAMSREVMYCFSDQEVDEVIANMAELKVRRMPVVDRNKRLVGVFSLADAALKTRDRSLTEALRNIVEPGGPHSQAA